jgi:PIN domain nuclease of toxin-antitoxin system
VNLLLDTNVLLWWLADSERLSGEAVGSISDEANDVAVSAATIWEISIKRSLGKLAVDGDVCEHIEGQSFRELPIIGRHAIEVENLPMHHRDPFDRMLVAQARCEGLTLLTGDRQLAKYDVPAILC